MSKMYCTHRECQLDAADELRWMIERLGREDLRDEMATALNGEVRCRHVPARSISGAPQAPFAPRRGS